LKRPFKEESSVRKPEKKIIPLWIFLYGLVTVPLSLLATAGLSRVVDYSITEMAVIFVLIGVATAIILGFVRFRAWRYTLRDDHLYLEYGIFIKVRTMMPYVRIQHIDSQRRVSDRLLGLSRLVVYTAGSRGADVAIPGLLPDDAHDMQEKLRDLAIESEDRDGV